MELRQLEIFRVLAHELNFTRTAERVFCVQSNVTVQIRALEAELGVVLFDRAGKQVRLTEFGQRLLPYAERVLGLLDEAKASMLADGTPKGLLRIGATESVLTYRLPPLLQALRERYPEVELVFVAVEASKLWGLLSRHAADLVFTIHDFSEQPALEVQTLCEEPMVFVTRPSHPLSERDTVKAVDLEGEKLLLTEDGCFYRRWLEQTLQSAGVRPGAAFTFTSVEAIKQCAALGAGIALLPQMALQAELTAGTLRALPWVGPSPSMKTVMGWHKDKWHSPAMAALLGVVRERFPLPPATYAG